VTGEPIACRTRAARLVDRAFVGDLPAWRRRRLRRHLAACASCRARYDRLALADRQLGGRDRLGAAAVADLERTLVAGATSGRRRRAVWAGVGALVTAAVVVLVVSLRDAGPPELRPRGPGVVLGDRMPGVRLFCVEGGTRVVAESRVVPVAGPVPALRCTLDAELQLAYSSPDLEGLTMVAFGRQGQSIRYYAPRAGDAEAVALAPDRVDEPLAWSTRLGVKHDPGAYEVVVRFYDRPVRAEDAAGGVVAPLGELRGRLELVSGSAP
jgi:hypothetical protein